MKRIILVMLFPMLVMGQTQIGEDIDGESSGDFSGRSLSISDNGAIVAIGANQNSDNGTNAGHVRIYENLSGIWTQVGDDLDGIGEFEQFGQAVSISSDGSIVAIGATGNDENAESVGQVKVFENQNNDWIQIGQNINGELAFDELGGSISLSSDGTILALGSGNNDGNGEVGSDFGHVLVYQFENSQWTQIGEDIIGESEGDLSGLSISLSVDGTILAINALLNDGNGVDTGHVRVFQNQSNDWVQIGQDIDGDIDDNFSGSDVSISGNGLILAIGSIFADGNGEDSGRVRVYEYQNDSWIQIGDDLNGNGIGDFFGQSVDLSFGGSLLVSGAFLNDDNGVDSGQVKLFNYVDDSWIEVGNSINGEASGDQLGLNISLSQDGNTVAVPASQNDGNGENSGHVRVYDLSNILSTPENTSSTFTLYPNPTKTQFNIQLSDGESLEKASIYNNLGQLITTTTQPTVDISALSSGVYFVNVETTAGKGVKKLMIE